MGNGSVKNLVWPHYPQQNGMVERVIRSLKEQCVHRHRFESLQHANRVSLGTGVASTTISAHIRR